MVWVVCVFYNGSQKATGLTPTIDIYDLSDNSIDVNGASMSEIGSTGIYKYNFSTFDNTKDYFWEADGGATLPAFNRYIHGDSFTLGNSELILEDTNEMQGKLPTNNIMGSSVKTDKDDEIDAILVDTNEIQGKLPTNNIMGSSVKTDKDGVIDAIKERTDNLPDDPISETQMVDVHREYIINNVWDEQTNLHEDSGSFGRMMKDIEDKTVNLPSDPASESVIESAISTAEGNIRGGDNDDLKDISDEIANLNNFDYTTEQVIVQTNNDKSGYELTTAEKNDIVDKVWDEDITDHQSVDTFGESNQNQVPSETLNDYKADVSLLSLETTSQAIKERTDNLPDDPSSESTVIDENNKPIIIATPVHYRQINLDTVDTYGVGFGLGLTDAVGDFIGEDDITDAGYYFVSRLRNGSISGVIFTTPMVKSSGGGGVNAIVVFDEEDWQVNDIALVTMFGVEVTRGGRSITLGIYGSAAIIVGNDCYSLTQTIDNNVDDIKAKTDNLPSNTETVLNAMITQLTRLLGLSHENVIQEHTFDDGEHIESDIYLYDSRANAITHDKSTGLIAKYTMTAEYIGGLPSNHRMVLEP